MRPPCVRTDPVRARPRFNHAAPRGFPASTNSIAPKKKRDPREGAPLRVEITWIGTGLGCSYGTRWKKTASLPGVATSSRSLGLLDPAPESRLPTSISTVVLPVAGLRPMLRKEMM